MYLTSSKICQQNTLIVVLSLQFVVVVVVVVDIGIMLSSVSIVLYLEVTYMYRVLITAIIKTYFRKSLRLDLKTLSMSLHFY